jgi:hypothetical protein
MRQVGPNRKKKAAGLDQLEKNQVPYPSNGCGSAICSVSGRHAADVNKPRIDCSGDLGDGVTYQLVKDIHVVALYLSDSGNHRLALIPGTLGYTLRHASL